MVKFGDVMVSVALVADTGPLPIVKFWEVMRMGPLAAWSRPVPIVTVGELIVSKAEPFGPAVLAPKMGALPLNVSVATEICCGTLEKKESILPPLATVMAVPARL